MTFGSNDDPAAHVCCGAAAVPERVVQSRTGRNQIVTRPSGAIKPLQLLRLTKRLLCSTKILALGRAVQ